MSDERKKPVWPWIAALLIGLPLMYVVSFGPACWVSSRAAIALQVLPTVYRPILMLMKIDDSPADLRARLTRSLGGSTTRLYFYPSGVVSQYASCFAAENWKWRFHADFEDHPDPVVRLTEGNWEWRDSSK